MMETLRAVQELQQAAGPKAKTVVLQKYSHNEDFKRILYYACHPRLTYKVSEDRLWDTPMARPDFHEFKSLWEVCDCLARNKAVPNLLLDGVLHFLRRQPDELRELYIKVIAKTLRLGVTAKTINKVFPGLFPEWNVQQSYPIEKHPFKDGLWFALTQKLNGVRCTFYRGQLIARSGEPFEGLDHIVDELSEWSDWVFDGELTLKNKGNLSDNEAFRTATGIINSDDDDKSQICFTIFDMLYAEEFDRGEGMRLYYERREFLDGLQKAFDARKLGSVSVLPVLYAGNDKSQIDVWLDRMVAEDKEGLMVNLNTTYKCKRHSGIIKVKRFYTMDLPIVRIEEGSGKYAGTTGALVVDYMGNEVGVGTGLTDEQRRFFWEFRDTYIGVLAEVKYKEISQDKKTGAKSLQFPVFVRLREDKTEVSYG